MEKQAAQNIQDAFLNSARRERLNVVVHLLQGATLTGRIKSFDKFSLLLDVGGPDVLVFKHAISSITQERRPASHSPAPAEQTQA
ncbi:MAG: RNA chaperone Hfq [Acidobacteria bacterium ACB1]|nr:RNA-binding protein Hfq [Pyrinomonadaceae bacterium]MCE7961267.1 RNA chaperone Hfq [Acidobacteria bacterium ACB1]RIJ94913.1 MAG: RNA chaperone Hfq [Acidobacteriota bacterium]